MLSYFSDGYATARDRFRQAAGTLGWELLSYPINAKGPTGGDLTIDVAIGPGAETDAALVLSTGIHGVEGFIGSAVQLAMMHQWANGKDAQPPVRIVLLHSLNPYGFAWRRRVNEDNVDINRNLLLEGESFSGCPKGCAELDWLFNPKRPPSNSDLVLPQLAVAFLRYGIAALKEAVASGQYEFPLGMFYGGDRPTETNAILTTHFNHWLGDARRVAHLDFHTGLGKWAKCRLLIDYPQDENHRRQLSKWFGRDSFESTDSNNISYSLRGSLGRWCLARNPNRDYLYATAEFGTYWLGRVIRGLRAENQAHHWAKASDSSTTKTKAQLVELFCPRSENWRRRVMNHSRLLVEQAVSGLMAEIQPQLARRSA